MKALPTTTGRGTFHALSVGDAGLAGRGNSTCGGESAGCSGANPERGKRS